MREYCVIWKYIGEVKKGSVGWGPSFMGVLHDWSIIRQSGNTTSDEI
jgi:hypothetical protein